ncbi:MAG: hypothetical protein DHS20C02_19620 [Micavibrio sp.]|nr:MAG: hypothetical protein DHS20C02_19620 [Micavibrio sp.]
MQPLDFDVTNAVGNDSAIQVKEIAEHCKTYKGSDAKRSIFQLATTLALFIGTCGLMLYSLNISYWITALLVLPAAGLLIRIFIFQHDCGHGSFFNSKAANDWTGRLLGVLTVTPYDFWRRAHNKHHATSGDLDRRSIGGIDTITVREYQALSKPHQLAYRIYRNPFVLLILGTPFYVMILQRFPFNQATNFYENYQTVSVSSIWKSIMLTNAAIVVCYGSVAFFVGLGPLLAIYLPTLMVTAWIGGWLFYIQHQFEDTYWEENKNWNIQEAALLGSSYYALPKIVQWFTGNIGLHHIHHLCSRIPNYKLQECMDARPELESINKLTFLDSLKCVSFKLWDEQKGKLVSFRHIEPKGAL